MRAFASSGRPTSPLTTRSRRIAGAPLSGVAALVLTSALLAACSESPIAPAADAPGAISKSLTATTNDGPYTITGTSSYANGAGPNGTSLYYIGFANTQSATWDDIKITQGATVISENFNNGSWNTANFEVADPVNKPGSAVGGAYFSSGCECNTPNNARGMLRTKAQFIPTEAAPLTIEGTLTSNIAATYIEDISFLLWRSAGAFGTGASLMLSMANWDGWTPIENFDNNVDLQRFGAGFYQGPVRIKVTDDGTNITVTFTKIPPAPATIQISNMPSAPSIGGSFTPQFVYTGDGITSVASSTTAVCSVTRGVVSFYAAGTCTLTASATASIFYESATGTAQSFTVLDLSTAAFTVNGGNPVQVNTPVAINGTVPSGFTVQYRIGSGAFVTGSTISLPTTGVYTVCLRLTNGTSVSNESCVEVPVYDPTAGFVTGGGWFMSPAKALKADESLAGKAHFAFVSKYEKGKNVPTGNTSFKFDVAGLSFASTSYEWLVVQGSSTSTNNTAQYKGVGKLTIGGVVQTGNYGFMLWAQDGTPDQFRIAITDPSGTMVYDNKIGSEFGTAISGGSIIVHIPKK
ncbi:MAG: hypothetical protein P3B76_02300 [Gemmatimonadota bacterium]|nr:hypothetical protein [Gemmatimonadota bacterium]